MDHLLLHCPVAFELWFLVFCLFGIHWVMPHKVIEVFESWQGTFGRHRNIGLWRLVPHCLVWCIWSERNARCFEGCERSLLEIKSFFCDTLLVWSVALSHFTCFSIPVLLDHCNFGSSFLPPHYIPNVLRLVFFINKIFHYLSKKKKNTKSSSLG